MKEYRIPLGGGDYGSDECNGILHNSDIIITNPPFSSFREYLPYLIANNARFLIIGPMNAITYKEIFPHIRDNRLWLGNGTVKSFVKPDGTVEKFGNICWYTNLDYPKRHIPIPLNGQYRAEGYLRYDYYNAINVNKVVDIPSDYNGFIGVPISFLFRYNPSQFEIVDLLNRYPVCDYFHNAEQIKELKGHACDINGKSTYARVVIRKKP